MSARNAHPVRLVLIRPGVCRRILASSCYPAFYRGHLRVNTPEYLSMMRKRKIWAEGSFAAMKREHNLSKIRKRGILAATEECLLSATAGTGRKTGTPCDFSTFQAWTLPIYTTLTPNSTTWSPDKSPRSGRYCRSDLGLSILLVKRIIYFCLQWRKQKSVYVVTQDGLLFFSTKAVHF